MSTWMTRVVACPRCDATLELRVALGINVARAPHRAACRCGATVHAVAAFEYSDLARGQLVRVALPDERARWRALEAGLAASVRRVFEHGSPLAHGLVTATRSRLVFGDEALREKLVLWSAALDDAVIECVKLRAFAAEPRLAAPEGRLVVVAVGDDDSLACAWFARDGDVAPTTTFDLPATWVHEATRDRASLSSRYPELFGAGYVSAGRFLVQSLEAT